MNGRHLARSSESGTSPGAWVSPSRPNSSVGLWHGPHAKELRGRECLGLAWRTLERRSPHDREGDGISYRSHHRSCADRGLTGHGLATPSRRVGSSHTGQRSGACRTRHNHHIAHKQARTA